MVSKPLLKVLNLVDGDKLAMCYLYEAMDRAKEVIQSYNVNKGTLGYDKYSMIWDLIHSRRTQMIHRPIMQQQFSSTLPMLTHTTLSLMVR